LEKLNKHNEKLKMALCQMEEKEKAIKAELAKDESYVDRILEYKKKLEELDKKLGVEKK
jgi:plasmid rolling circle replication initiator protein Rep